MRAAHPVDTIAAPLRLATLAVLTASRLLCQTALGQLELGAGVILDLVRVPAGAFAQQVPGEPGRAVEITREFWLGRCEVTRGQFARFVAATKYRTEAERGQSGGYGWNGAGLEQRPGFTWRAPGFVQTDAHPVCLVTFNDALQFCRWASDVSGRAVSLPSEAQWEHACRLGGDPADLARAAWYDKTAGDGTRPVATAAADALGLFDMRGNVFEWCRDWFVEPYPPGAQRDPIVTASAGATRRVLRGGSWRHGAKNCAAGARWRSDPASRSCDNGFRVVVADAVGATASAPARDAAPRQAEPPRDETQQLPPSVAQRGCIWSPWFLGPVALAALALLARRGKRTPSSAPAPRSAGATTAADRARAAAAPGLRREVRVEHASDGAWLFAAQSLGELLVTARHRARNQPWKQSRLRLFGKQFVYTGYAPEDFEILEVAPAGDEDATWGAGMPGDAMAPPSPRDDDDLGSAGGLLSAY